MKKFSSLFFSLFFVCLFFSTLALSQINMPQPSPLCKISQKVGLAEITLAYSRPSAKGRVIFGDIVPFDKMWRTGANTPTKIKFDDEMIFEGNKVAAGEYSLMTIPGKNEWTVVLNKDSKKNGAFTYQESEDVAKFKVKTIAINNAVETFTMNFTDLTNTSANLELSWEKTAVKIKIENDVDSKVLAQIKKQLDPNRDAGLYFQIASYYYETNRELNEALSYATKAADMNPKYWVVHLKAKIQHKLKDYAGAIASAEKSLTLAKDEKDDNYIRMNEKLIADSKKAQ